MTENKWKVNFYTSKMRGWKNNHFKNKNITIRNISVKQKRSKWSTLRSSTYFLSATAARPRAASALEETAGNSVRKKE